MSELNINMLKSAGSTSPLFISALLVLYFFSLFCGYIGIDFGFHWDESTLLNNAQYSVDSGEFSQSWYNYPGASYRLAYYGLRALNFLNDISGSSIDPYIFIRCLFLSVSSLGIIWIGLAGALCLDRNKWTGLLAAMFMCSSWEYGYHSRWMAPDTLMASFAIGTVYFCLKANKCGSKRYLFNLLAAGLCLGMATASKYPAALLCVPLLITILGQYAAKKRNFLQISRDSVLAFVSATLVFLVITPGLITHYEKFYSEVRQMADYYLSHGHGGYTVSPGLGHLRKMLVYLLMECATSIDVLKIPYLFFIFCGIGVVLKKCWSGDIETRISSAVITIFPFLYLIYFSLQSVMIVRNIMLILPFVFLFMAIGVSSVLEFMKKRIPVIWMGGLTCMIVVIAINAKDVLYKAGSIAKYAEHEIETFEFPKLKEPLWISSNAKNLFKDGAGIMVNGVRMTEDVHAAKSIIFTKKDISSWWMYTANSRGLYHVSKAGPYEVNLDYYPSWEGPERPILIAREKAEDALLWKECINSAN